MMDRSILNLVPPLLQAAAALGRRSMNVSGKILIAQVAYAREVTRSALTNEQTEGTEALLQQVDSTRAHLRQIAQIFSQETRALELDLAAISEGVRSLAERENQVRMYRRRWRAKP